MTKKSLPAGPRYTPIENDGDDDNDNDVEAVARSSREALIDGSDTDDVVEPPPLGSGKRWTPIR